MKIKYKNKKFKISNKSPNKIIIIITRVNWQAET